MRVELNGEFSRRPGAVGCMIVFKEANADGGTAEMQRATRPVLVEVCSYLLQLLQSADIPSSKFPRPEIWLGFGTPGNH